MNRYDLIVVGGGASGMMAAGRAAERGLRVLLLEKNARLGEKLRITGGGRCNVTNAEDDVHVLLAKYGKAEQFLYSPFSQFSVSDTFAFFEARGLPLVVEGLKRAFPSTQKAEDVVRVMEEYARGNGVEVRLRSPVTEVAMRDGRIASVRCGKDEYQAKEYAFATGSVSHPETGSTGDGFQWLKDLGHTVHDPTPTIVPLAVTESWVHDLAGISLEGMKITFTVNGKKAFSLSGKLLFTHFGISGPLILNSAHRVADLLQEGSVTATIDAYPRTDLGALDQRVLGIFDANKNKLLRNVLKDLVPAGMAKGISTLLSAHVDLEREVNSVPKEERKKMVQLMKALPMTIEGLMGLDRAVIADGGVPLTEIDPRTMRSKVVPNLLVTGDLLHINRPSGGYSLQLCWSTGAVAGMHAGEVA